MTIYLVRHAVALSRQQWTGDDDMLRPLTTKGFAQAEGLIDQLAGQRIDTIVSSPAVRCTQTVVPLAEERGLQIVKAPVLLETTAVSLARRLLDEVDHAVLCSHGDLIPDLIDELIGEGMEAVGRDWEKGSTWTLDRKGPAFVRGTYVPPPKVEV